MARALTSLELCAGAGGTALGIAQAGFHHLALLDNDPHACGTLRYNRPEWNVIQGDLRNFSGIEYLGVDLMSAGVPCPPFSIAGKRLGPADDRDLFPEVVRLTEVVKPRAVMIENVPGIMTEAFSDYRSDLDNQFRSLGYQPTWKLLQSSDYGVSQLRPRVVMVALREALSEWFEWPAAAANKPPTVGELLGDAMAAEGWRGANQWARNADRIAPTLVGGSKKHGGPDLGPSRAKQAWAELGVNGHTLAEEPPSEDFKGMPRLTVQMAAVIQGFPPGWQIVGRKTNAYRQVGNAFPPPVALAVATAIRSVLDEADLPNSLLAEAG